MSVNISFLNAVQAVLKSNAIVNLDGVSIDRQAAVAVMKVYDSLDEGMKEKFLSRPVAHVVAIAKDLVKSFNTEKLSPVQKKIVAHRIPGMLVKAAQENTTLLGTVGIAIGTDSEDMLKASAEERGLVYADLDSDKITKDSLEIENRVAKWLEKEFGNVSLQGHSDNDLLGDMQIYRNMDKIEDSIDRQEPLRTGSGTLSLNDIPDLFDGLNYLDLYNDISVEFYDLQKEPEMEMDQASITASDRPKKVVESMAMSGVFDFISSKVKDWDEVTTRQWKQDGLKDIVTVFIYPDSQEAYVSIEDGHGHEVLHSSFDGGQGASKVTASDKGIKGSVAVDGSPVDDCQLSLYLLAGFRNNELLPNAWDVILERAETDLERKATSKMPGVEESARCIEEIKKLMSSGAELSLVGKVTASKNLPAFKVTFEDGNTMVTSMSASVTLEAAKKYYVGKSFTFGTGEEGDPERQVKAVSVEEVSNAVTAAGKRYTDNEWVLAEALRGKPNTKIYEENGKVVVKLYDTVIAKWDPAANTVELASGGFLTETTKTRINEVLTVLKFHSRVMMKKGSWFVSEQGGESLPYEEGFVVTSALNSGVDYALNYDRYIEEVLGEDVTDVRKNLPIIELDPVPPENGEEALYIDVDGNYYTPLHEKGIGDVMTLLNESGEPLHAVRNVKIVQQGEREAKASKKVESGEYSKEKEKELRDLAKEAREKREAFKGDESSKEYKALNKDFDEKHHAYMAYTEKGKIDASKKVKADAMANDMKLSDWDAVLKDKTDSDGAYPTNRVIAEDPEFENPEFVESAYVNGVPVKITYRIPASEIDAIAETSDLGSIDWENKINSIEVDLVSCDKEDIPDEKIAEVLDKYNPSGKVKASKDKSVEDLTKEAEGIKKDLAEAKKELKKSDTESNKSKVVALEEKLTRLADIIRNKKADKVKASKKTTAGGGAGVGFKVKDLGPLYFDLQGDTLIPQGDFSKCIDLLEVDGYEEGLRVLDDDASVYFEVTSIEISEIPVKELATLKEDPADASGIALDAGYSTLTGMIWRGWTRGKPEDAVVTVEDYVNFYTNSGFQFEGKLTMTIKFTEEGVNWYYDEFLQQDDPEPEDDEDPTDLDTESLEVKSSERKYAPKPVNNKVYASTKVNEAVPQEVMDSYLEAALWTEEERFKEEDENWDSNIHPSFSEAFLERAKQDLGKFLEDNKEAIEQFLVDEGQDLTQIAHSFWLTRNGHGAGFMDFGSDSARELDEAAKSFQSLSLYVGDGDGLVYAEEQGALNDFKTKAAKEIKSDEDLSMDMFTFEVDDIEISDPSADFTFTLDGKVYEGRITTNRAYRGRGGELNLNSVDFDDRTAEESLGEDMVSFIGDFIATHLNEIFNGAPKDEDDEVLADTFDS
jgi:hypothetical protein